MSHQKCRPSPAFFNEDGEPDFFVWVLLCILKSLSAVVLIGGPIWAISRIPNYVELWHRQFYFAALSTEFMLLFSTLTASGAVAAYDKRVAQRLADRIDRVARAFSVLLYWISIVPLAGFFLWNMTELPTGLHLWISNRGLAIAIVAAFLFSLMCGLYFRWGISRFDD